MRILTAMLVLFCSHVCLAADTQPAGRGALMKTLDGVEDVRLLFCSDCYRIHELDSLLRYASGFGVKGVDLDEPRTWHIEALTIFERLKSLDDAGQDLTAWADYAARQGGADLAPDLRLMNEMLGDCAARVGDFHARLDKRLAEARQAATAAAAAKGLGEPALLTPRPWNDVNREIGRRMGAAIVWPLWMNHAPGSKHAALDRQQSLDNEVLLAKAAKLGVRGIIPEFSKNENLQTCSWGVAETQRGRYDFTRLDRTIAAISRHGIKTVVPIRSLEADLPAWTAQTLGDNARIWRWDDKQAKPVPSDGVNLMDGPTREAFLGYLTALCRHLKQRHANDVLAVTLEVFATDLPATVDYSPPARKHFQKFLAARYGTAEKLNQSWQSQYGSFDEIDIPAPRKEPPVLAWPGRDDAEPAEQAARWADWLAWRKAYVAEYFAAQADVIRRELPGVAIQAYAIRADSHNAHTERPVASWPLEAMAGIADLPSSCATVEPVQVLLRSVGQGRFAGQQAEQNFGSMLGGAAYSGFLKDAIFSVARDGPEVMLRYFYSPGLYGYMDRQIDWDGAYGFRMKLRDMAGLAATIENTSASPTGLAVLWSQASFDQDPTRYSRWGALGMCYALMCTKVHYDIVTESQVRAGALDRYTHLIIPEQRYLDDATTQAVRKFVSGGGRLFATSAPGLFDPAGRLACKTAVPASAPAAMPLPLSDVFGASVVFTPIQAVMGTFLVPTHPASIWDNRERGTLNWTKGFAPREWTLDRQLCASLEPTAEARTLLRFVDGTPALVANRFGKGEALLMGYPFGHEYALSNPTEMCFGKIYPHWSYPEQMTALERWLGEFVHGEFAFAQPVEVPKSWMDRFTGMQRSGPALSYPGRGDTYADKRTETDGPNHSLAISLRGRDGVGTTYLTVFNRDSAYAASRGYLHYMASPTYAVIKLNRTDVRAVYDIVNHAHVPVVRGDLSLRPDRKGEYPDADKCVSFLTVVPPYFGRVYAISAEAKVEVFADSRGEATDDALRRRVAALAKPWRQPPVLIVERAELVRWFNQTVESARATTQPAKELVISYGSPAYRPAAEMLAEALRAKGLAVKTSVLGVLTKADGVDPYYKYRGSGQTRLLEQIDVYIGNDFDNDNLADLTAVWQRSRNTQPTLPVSVNREFPGDDRAVLMLTRGLSVAEGRPGKDGAFGATYHSFTPQSRKLVIGASSPAGAVNGVKAWLDIAILKE